MKHATPNPTPTTHMDLNTANLFETIEDRADTIEAVIAQTRADVAELFRRLDNNQDDDYTTATRVDEVTTRLNKQLKAIETINKTITISVNTGTIQTQINKTIADKLTALEHDQINVDNLAKILEDIHHSIDTQTALNQTASAINNTIAERLDTLEEKPGNTTLEQISQRLAATETRLNHTEYAPTDTPFAPHYPNTGTPYPETPRWTTQTDSRNTGYETKNTTNTLLPKLANLKTQNNDLHKQLDTTTNNTQRITNLETKTKTQQKHINRLEKYTGISTPFNPHQQ